ncbi:phage portal protein [Sphingomonas sp. NFR15]|uniref:phage portal protein n=1 Tax=Sphingomonas sp. NFR15 TaxID=1566282 RepID=UPI00088A969C|nr:phage portal protein [Sphingomonas sp. NFR15]SDA35186.1 phage portal protein, HK97 family [Sphingomonas sp. NFR15]
MKLFGWKSAGRDVRPVLARYGLWSGGGSPGEWSDDYAAQVRQGYCRNAVAQRAVRLVAQGLAGAPLAASSPELLALVTARSGGQALTETVAAHLLLHGNAYVQIMTDPAGAVVELFALRPERVSVEADAGGWPVAYRYRVGERVTRLMADGTRPEVVHLRGFHPLDDHYGLGCLGATAGAIALHNAAARWNKALLDNAARPSGALVHDPGDGSVLSREQFERLRTEMEAGFAGAGNAGRPMLLGLPGDATYANYREASRALWRLAILPLADTIFSGLAQGLAGWFEAPWLRVNVDKVTALAEDRERLWAQVNAAGFLSDEEKRAMLGLSAEHAGGVA